MDTVNTPALNFVMLYVFDLDAALQFFTDTLSFSHVSEQDTPVFRFLRGGEGGLDFAVRQATADTPPPGAVELYFQTPDLAGLHTQLSGKGLTTTPIMRRPFASIFTFNAPDGHHLTMTGNN